MHVVVLSLQVLWVFTVTWPEVVCVPRTTNLSSIHVVNKFCFLLLCGTVCPVDDGHQSEADFMHTISGSSTVNNLLALPSEYASEDIPNKDDAEEDDFPISHDDAYDGHVSSETSNCARLWCVSCFPQYRQDIRNIKPCGHHSTARSPPYTVVVPSMAVTTRYVCYPPMHK
jgi:hypothetical protein